LLDSTEENLTGYFEFDCKKQGFFDQFLQDQRYLSGKQIAYFCKTLCKSLEVHDPIEPSDIVDFLQVNTLALVLLICF